MKRKFRSIAVIAVSILTAAAFTFPSDVLAASKGNPSPTATNVEYVMKGGKKTGIKSFTLSPYKYYNMSTDSELNPSGDPTMKMDTKALSRISEKEIFPKWSIIAENVFRNQADQIVSIGTDSMLTRYVQEDNSFDEHFSYSKWNADERYKSEDWSLSDLAKILASKNGISKGEVNWDYAHSTGITSINSLADARDMMGQQLRNASDDDDVSKDDFLGNSYKGKSLYRLPDLEEPKSGSGFCNIVTCINRAGASGNYDYATFGLAVYDFDLTPMAAKDLAYIEAAQDFKDEDNPFAAAKAAGVPGVDYNDSSEDAVKTMLRNESRGEATQTVSLEQSTTEEYSNTMEDSKEFSLEESVGAEVNMGSCCECVPRVTASFNVTSGQVWTTTKSDTHTSSTTKTKSVSAEIPMPAHTCAQVVQNTECTNITETYQSPVVLTYKVAVFAMSGDYFNGWWGGVNASAYDKEWMSVLFKGTEDASLCGHQALGSLYSRAVRNKDISGYDLSHGNYKSWCDKGEWVKTSGIEWDKIEDNIMYDHRDSHSLGRKPGGKVTVADFAATVPICEKGSIFSSKKEIMTSSVKNFAPLNDLASVSIKKEDRKVFDMSHGETLYLDGMNLEGYDGDDVEFYGFDSGWGTWAPCTPEGEDREQTPDDVATLETDEATGSQTIKTINGETEGGTVYFKWHVNDDAKIISNESPGGMSKADKAKIDTPVLGIRVAKNNSINDNGKIVVIGTYEGSYLNKINLNNELEVDVYDSDDSRKEVPVQWEAQEKNNISVDPNTGETEFLQPGIYHVRPYCISNSGNKVAPGFVTIRAISVPVLSRMEFNAPEMSQTKRTLTRSKQEITVDLDQCTGFFDQYDSAWTGEEPKVDFTVEGGEGALVDDNNTLRITRPGTYEVTATSKGLGSKSFEITILQENWLDEIILTEPALSKKDLTLTETQDEIQVRNLKGQLEYYDRSGAEWTGSKPRVTFSLADGYGDDARVVGDTFFATKAGTYVIEASANGYEINSISITVDDGTPLVIKTSNPPEQQLRSSDEPTEVELIHQVDFVTKNGSAWKGEKPELVFSLDSGTKNAKIKDGNIFTCTKAGTYKVHVKAADTSQYSGTIPDIVIVASGTYIHWGAWTMHNDQQHVRTCEDDTSIVDLKDHQWKKVLTGTSEDPEKPDIVKSTCSVCGGEITETIAHEWTKPEYEANSDHSMMTASRKCTHEGCITETETAEIIITSKPDPKDPEATLVTFTADFKNPAFKWSETDRYSDEGAFDDVFTKGLPEKIANLIVKYHEGEKDPAGTKISPLKLRSIKQGKKNIRLRWNKNKNAKKYIVYGNLCGKKFKKIKTLKGNTLNVKKAAGRKLKNGRYYKFIVLAINSKDRLVTASKVIHVGTKAKKSGNPTKLTVKAKVNKYGKVLKKYKATGSIALKAGKITRLKAVQKKLRGYKVKKHAKIRYQSSDVNIATINSYGKIKAKKKGSCKVFVYTQNGICKTVKVKVR